MRYIVGETGRLRGNGGWGRKVGEARTPLEENAWSKHATRSSTHTYQEVLHYGISFSWSCLADSALNPVGGVSLCAHSQPGSVRYSNLTHTSSE